jgi:hypothetical protein
MGKRVTTAELGAKLDTLIDILTAQAMPADIGKTGLVETPATSVEVETPTEDGEVAIDEAYLAHMNAKAADHATCKGSEVVLYARKNKRAETKLAYALRERYDDVIVSQPSHIGAVGSFQP